MSKIKSGKARTILDSRGKPTIEVDIALDNGIIGRASVPSGASTGSREALELRDKDFQKYLGMGVNKAISNVEKLILPKIINMEVTEQRAIDQKMIELDGTENKNKLGANAILGVSLAVAKAAAIDLRIPLYKYFGKLFGEDKPHILPVPMMNFINGGAHANNKLDFQEFMIMPTGAKNFSEALYMGSQLFRELNNVFFDSEGSSKNESTKEKELNYIAYGVGDEGGFSPIFLKNEMSSFQAITEEALKILVDGIKAIGYKPGKDISIALDPAASEFYKNGKYRVMDGEISSEEMVDFYVKLVEKYYIVSIEDGMAENDLEGWKLLTKELGNKIQLVGDDLFVTNPKILQDGIRQGIANAILIKVNQIGTLTETLDTIKRAHNADYNTVISHRSGETEDTTISDLAVGCNAMQIKTGCMARTDRTIKYNRLLKIEEELDKNAMFLHYKPINLSVNKIKKKVA